ncbi:hypothetical protein QL285_015181 [Trifolium repens]|nr:hypothetical protein QL285_015181 [Trifolium repens]
MVQPNCWEHDPYVAQPRVEPRAEPKNALSWLKAETIRVVHTKLNNLRSEGYLGSSGFYRWRGSDEEDFH